MKIFGSKIDRLARKKRVLALKKEKIQTKMKEKNSEIENKIQMLENKSFNNKLVADRKSLEIDRQLEKTVRDIDSEQIYVNAVAESEKTQYQKENEEREESKQLKGMECKAK